MMISYTAKHMEGKGDVSTPVTKYGRAVCLFSVFLCLNLRSSTGFLSPSLNRLHNINNGLETLQEPLMGRRVIMGKPTISPPSSSSSALNVWWFGGTENSEMTDSDAESCELVAVRIERTSPNSRRIAGEITVPTRLTDVWAIITDYNRLATHIPNLVESNIVGRTSTQTMGEQGNGSFRCKLYQKGAQKIVGFDFSASVTMDMTEQILKTSKTRRIVGMDDSDAAEDESEMIEPLLLYDRRVGFKCADSFFFKEFDGDWVMKEQYNEDGEIETVVSYVVDVRPKGPVPVAALEWQIQSEVPTNLRAVKKAAMEVGERGVQSYRERVLQSQQRRSSSSSSSSSSIATADKNTNNNNIRRISLQKVDRAMRNRKKRATVVPVSQRRNGRPGRQKTRPAVAAVVAAETEEEQDWDLRDETMAAYLTD